MLQKFQYIVCHILKVEELDSLKDPIGYDIITYGIFLQKDQSSFSGLLDRKVHVSAIVSCHPSKSADFDKVYFVFIDDDSIPDFDETKHIRVDDGEKRVYLFRASKFLGDYVDLLRNEKPITLWWSKKDNAWQLATGKSEPVGEGAGERTTLPPS